MRLEAILEKLQVTFPGVLVSILKPSHCPCSPDEEIINNEVYNFLDTCLNHYPLHGLDWEWLFSIAWLQNRVSWCGGNLPACNRHTKKMVYWFCHAKMGPKATPSRRPSTPKPTSVNVGSKLNLLPLYCAVL